jgi:hypothetical protein
MRAVTRPHLAGLEKGDHVDVAGEPSWGKSMASTKCPTLSWFAPKWRWRGQKIQRQNRERAEVRLKAIAMAKAHGFNIDELFGRGRKSKRAVKYRDPKNPANTWTGRGGMPLWLASTIKGEAIPPET